MQEITDWQDSVFTKATPLSAAIHLQREIRELVFDIKNGNPLSAKFELADCFLLLVGVAHLSNIDLEAAAIEKLEINKAREWGEPDAEGVVEHIKGKTLLEIFEADGLLSNAGSIGYDLFSITPEQSAMLDEILAEDDGSFENIIILRNSQEMDNGTLQTD